MITPREINQKASVRRIYSIVNGGGLKNYVFLMSVGHTFFLLASAYSHGTQESHDCLLATAHTSRVTDLLRSISVFPVKENHVNTKGNRSTGHI